MMYIHQVLCNIVFTYLEFIDKHAFKRICKYTNKIEIIDLYDIDRKHLKKLNDDILLNYKSVRRLDACSNYNITNVKHMTKLKELIASFECGISDNGIENINLEKLNCECNPNITNVNHMTNLKELNASMCFLDDPGGKGGYGIDDNGIKNINLEKLYVSYNHKITNVNHMTKLKILDASCGCGIDDDGIEDLNLEYLNAVANPKITSENHMTNLKGSIKYMLNR